MNNKKYPFELIIVLGATATGKTNLAVKIANQLNGEIISADSRQIYKKMDIGTGKDYNEYYINNKKIPYHLIDILEPDIDYSVYQFQNDFKKAFEKIKSRNKMPILCGGTGLYIESILLDYPLLNYSPDQKLRKKLEYKSIKELREMAGNEFIKNTNESEINNSIDTDKEFNDEIDENIETDEDINVHSDKNSKIDKVPKIKTKRFYSPLVKSMAKKENVALEELENIKGSGNNGRVNKTDFIDFLNNRDNLSKNNQSSSLNKLESNEYFLEDKVEEVEQMKLDSAKKSKYKLMKNSMKKNGYNPNRASKDKLDIICKYVDILSPKRASNYPEWIQVGWCLNNLHNYDDLLLDKWIEFSKKDYRYVETAEDECRERWVTMQTKGLGMGSLKKWAREDNIIDPETNEPYKNGNSPYQMIRSTEVFPFIPRSYTKKGILIPYEVAKIMFLMFCDKFKCVSSIFTCIRFIIEFVFT